MDAEGAGHSFVSLLSDDGVPLEQISQLVGHSSTAVTELVYRKQIRPVLQSGAVTMDRIFGVGNGSHAVSHSAGAGDATDEGQSVGDLA